MVKIEQAEEMTVCQEVPEVMEQLRQNMMCINPIAPHYRVTEVGMKGNFSPCNDQVSLSYILNIFILMDKLHYLSQTKELGHSARKPNVVF